METQRSRFNETFETGDALRECYCCLFETLENGLQRG